MGARLAGERSQLIWHGDMWGTGTKHVEWALSATNDKERLCGGASKNCTQAATETTPARTVSFNLGFTQLSAAGV